MNDNITLAQEKREIQRRIRKGIVALRRRLVNRADITLLDRVNDLITPTLAYREVGRDLLSGLIKDLNRDRTPIPKKLAVVFHEIAHLLIQYWELVRTDETTGLYSRLDHLEGWAKYGLDECDLLGGPNVGYSLFNRTVQREG